MQESSKNALLLRAASFLRQQFPIASGNSLPHMLLKVEIYMNCIKTPGEKSILLQGTLQRVSSTTRQNYQPVVS